MTTEEREAYEAGEKEAITNCQMASLPKQQHVSLVRQNYIDAVHVMVSKLPDPEAASHRTAILEACERYHDYIQKHYPAILCETPDPDSLFSDLEAESKDANAAKLSAAVETACDQAQAHCRDAGIPKGIALCFASGFFDKLTELTD